MHVDSFFHEETISLSVEELRSNSEPNIHRECPLKRWIEPISQLTRLYKKEHLKEPYSALIDKLRQQEINTDTARYEFLKIHPRCGESQGTCCQ